MFNSSRIQGITFHTSRIAPPETERAGGMGYYSATRMSARPNQQAHNDAGLGGARVMGGRTVSLIQEMNDVIQRIIEKVQAISEFFEQVEVIEPLDPPKNRAIDYISQLIDEINTLSSSITVDGNAPLGKGGKPFSLSLGDGTAMTINAHDLSMDLEEFKVSMAADFDSYWNLVSFQLQMGDQVKDYLQEQLANVEALTSSTRQNAMKNDTLDLMELHPDEAVQMASESARQVLKLGTNILDMSMDSHPQTIAKLLLNPV